MPRYGIDTSIFVRLLTGDPAKDYEQTRAALEKILHDDAAAEIEVSNLVIAEGYFAVQHHYGVPKDEARAALVSVLTSGLVKPQLGQIVLEALSEAREPGVLDRLIATDYAANGLITVTNDRKMSRLPRSRLL